MLEFSDPAVYLSWLIFLPAVAALVITFFPARGETLKWISLGATIVVAIMSLGMLFGTNAVHFATDPAELAANMQHQFAYDWIPSFKIQYLMGIDGISFPLIVL